jgi:glycosyltransferase 2 family protein
MRLGLRLLGPVLLLAVLLRLDDGRQVLRVIADAAPWPLVAAVALNVVNIHLKVVRWDVLLRTRSIVYPIRKAWGAFLTSLYIGMLTPGRVGDVLRAQYLRHDLGVPWSEGIASVVMDRLCDLYVLAVFVAIGVLRFGSALVGRLAIVTWIGLALTVLLPLLLLIPGVLDRPMRAVYGRFAREGAGGGVDGFLEALRAQLGRSLLLTIPLTVATFLVNYLQGWLIASALGVQVSFFDVVCLLSIASLLGLMPISVSGVGVRELFFALIFPTLGYAAEMGVSFGLLVFVVMYLAIVAGGFVSWMISPPPTAAPPPPPPAEAR